MDTQNQPQKTDNDQVELAGSRDVVQAAVDPHQIITITEPKDQQKQSISDEILLKHSSNYPRKSFANTEAISIASLGRSNLKRSYSKTSRKSGKSFLSRRSYISNFSVINRKNLSRFGRSKITFLVLNTIFTFIGLSLTLFSIFTWINNFYDAPLLMAINPAVITSITAAASVMAFTGFLGFLGAFAHKKIILTIYVLLTWPVFGGWITVGYLSFKELNTPHWEVQMSDRWNTYMYQKQLIQDKFSCCGYLSSLDRPFIDATCTGLINSSNPSQPLQKRQLGSSQQVVDSPACHDQWLEYVSDYLRLAYSIAFSLTPLTLFAFMIGLLASNHIYD